MLDMLPPGAALQRIELEGVAPEDLAGNASDERFVGVDVTEYEGGEDGRSAGRIILTQVRYSPTHPDHAWNLARLTASHGHRRRRGGATRPTSVLGKLATAFASLRRELPTLRRDVPGPDLVLRLHTNQPLDPSFRAHVEAVRRSLLASRAALSGVASNAPVAPALSQDVIATRNALRDATSLTDPDFYAFLTAWDLDAFGSSMLAAEEAALFGALTTYTSDVHIENLLSFMQERASTHRPSDVRRETVLGLLRVLERDLWPAPPLFEPDDDLIETDDVRRLRAEVPPATEAAMAGVRTRPLVHAGDATTTWRVRSTTGHEFGSDVPVADMLVVHGPTGAGKTSTLRLLSPQPDRKIGGPVVLVYDSFANGQGLEPSSARFPIRTCLTEVINELDAVLHTAVLATARLNDQHLVERFEKAVGAAARAAASRGRRLVLAFDAVDNALDTAGRAPIRGDAFVPLLWCFAWPRNCTVVVSARTENLAELGVPPDARQLELQGFTLEELTRVGARNEETDAAVLERLHSRTGGNPRVATRVLQALALLPANAPVKDRLEVVEGTARETAFAYYRQQTPERVRLAQDRLTLAVLAEATQSVTLDTLALLAGRTTGDVRALVERLSFGLRLDPGDVIAFRDQDFWDYVHEEFRAELEDARRTLAAFVRARYGSHPYAAANFSRHLYGARQFDDLVQWWLDGDRLAHAIDDATPYVDRVFEDVQYALLAASNTGRDADAVTLLALAADVVHGRDLFLDHLLQHPDIVLALGALDEALGTLNARDPDATVLGHCAALAAAAAGDPAHAGRARELLARVRAVRRAIYRRNETSLEHRCEVWGARKGAGADADADAQELWRDVFHLDDITAEAIARVRAFGPATAITWLTTFTRPESLGSAFAAVVPIALSPTRRDSAAVAARPKRVSEVVRSIESAIDRQVPAVMSEVALAVLASAAGRLSGAERDRLVGRVLADEVLPSTAGGSSERSAASAWRGRDDRGAAVVRPAVESLMKAGALDQARELAPLARGRAPTYAREPTIGDFLVGEALQDALGLGAFGPMEYEVPGRMGENEPPRRGGGAEGQVAEGKSGHDYEARRREEEERRELSALRTRLAARYPAELLRARALLGVPDAEAQRFLGDVRAVLDGWLAKARDGRAEWDARWSDWQGDYPLVMATLLEAVVLVSRRDAELARAVLDATDRLLAPGPGRGLEKAALVLSSDERYHAQAEYAISLLRRDARPPVSRPADGVDALLQAYSAARRFDPRLAAALAREAREVANAVEAEISGRAAGLASLADRATAHGSPTEAVGQGLAGPPADARLSARRLVRLFSYLASVAENGEEVGVGEALRYLARVDPAGAAAELTALDREGSLDLGRGALAVAEGVIEGSRVAVDAAWPLVNLAEGNGDRVYRMAVEAALTRGEPFESVLTAFATDVCRRSSFSRRGEIVAHFLQWAEACHLSGHAAVAAVRTYAQRLDAMPAESADGDARGARSGPYAAGRPAEWRDPSAESAAALEAVRMLLKRSPPRSLQALSAIPVETLHHARPEALQQTFAALAEELSSARIGELARQAERAAREFSADAFLCLGEVARGARTTPSAADVKASYRRLLTPNALRVVAAEYYPVATRAALQFPLLDDRARLRTLVSAAGERLAEFGAGTLYRLSGLLSALLSPAEAIGVLGALVGRAWSRLPPDVRTTADAVVAQYGSSLEQTPGHGEEVGSATQRADGVNSRSGDQNPLVGLLADLHGHPERRVRWGAVHAAVEMVLALPVPTIEILVAETFDATHARWLTKREWLLFTLECLARCQPAALLPHAVRLAAHALTPDLPHAKIRHHAREIVLAVDRAERGALDADELVERVRAVNQPKALRAERQGEWRPFPRQREYREREAAWPEYHFDSLDTLPYWYEPLARVFNVTQDDVGDIAYEWIVHRWGITRAVVEASWAEERSRLDYGEYGHGHGGEPSVEIVERYADRHGLYVAAGTLIETQAVVNDGPREGDRWREWARDHLRVADPALTSHLLSPAPPETPDHYGRFTDAYDVWRRKESLDEFLAELTGTPMPIPLLPTPPGETGAEASGIQGEWIVVAATRSASVRDRAFSARVDGALVSPRTAEALQRLIHDAPRQITLPELDLGHDTILADLEHDQRTRTDYYVREQHAIRSAGGLFRLRALCVECRPELRFEDKDPRWPETARPFFAPINAFVDSLGLTREEHELLWSTPDGTPAARCEVWFERDGTADYSDHAAGARLLVRRDMLLEYARRVASDVLLVVTLHRRRPYRDSRLRREEEDEPYDFGDWVAFRLRRDGALSVTPRGTRAPDERGSRPSPPDEGAAMSTETRRTAQRSPGTGRRRRHHRRSAT